MVDAIVVGELVSGALVAGALVTGAVLVGALLVDGTGSGLAGAAPLDDDAVVPAVGVAVICVATCARGDEAAVAEHPTSTATSPIVQPLRRTPTR